MTIHTSVLFRQKRPAAIGKTPVAGNMFPATGVFLRTDKLFLFCLHAVPSEEQYDAKVHDETYGLHYGLAHRMGIFESGEAHACADNAHESASGYESGSEQRAFIDTGFVKGRVVAAAAYVPAN